MKRVIAISGAAASGKDSVALFLKEQLEGVEIFSFSSELKRVATSLWSMSGSLNDYQTKAKYRDKLISLGKAVRSVDINTWVDIVINKIKETALETAVITDLRFSNELARLALEFPKELHLLRLGALLDVRLNRMEKDRAKEYIEKGFYKDSSETELDFLETYGKYNIDNSHVLYNNGDKLDELAEKVGSYTKFMQPLTSPYKVSVLALEFNKEAYKCSTTSETSLPRSYGA